MKKLMFALKDTKAEVYHGPYTAVNENVFLRDLASLEGSDTQFAKHPADFAVYRLGTIDDSTGVIDSCPPVHIINLDDLFGSLKREVSDV